MNNLDEALVRLNELEPGLRSLDTLFALGEVIKGEKGHHNAGDFDLTVWEHSMDGFSVGAIVRARMDGKPFPSLNQSQKKWILCCKGRMKIVYGENIKTMGEGERLTIPSKTPHEIYPITEDCSAIIVTVPADPGMR